jgi:excisionase family DNA binding protein
VPSAVANSRCMSPLELATHWGCGVKRVRAMVHRGQIRAFRLGRAVRIPPDAVAEAEGRLAVPTARPRRMRNVVPADIAAELEAD